MSLTPPPLTRNGPPSLPNRDSAIEKTTQETSSEPNNDIQDKASEFKCGQCGAKLTYQPGSSFLICSYCEHQNQIPKSEEDIKELDFHQFLQSINTEELSEEKLFIKCNSCGAESSSGGNITSQTCPFCDSDIVSTAQSKKILKPRSLLPFQITATQAKDSYKTWLKKLWFAPNALKKKARQVQSVVGMYVPHWTYDADTFSYYRGQRGTYYYVSVSRTRKNSEGETETYTERERRTRWYPVSGTVSNDFDDVLVVASKSLPRKYTQELEPWDLQNLTPYKDEYLSGFKSESYQVSLDEGFATAKGVMDIEIRHSVERHIGGDEQRISSLKTQHSNITFKHILLPVWLSTYRYKNKVYRFLVNARTGEVQGERPWSWVKIALASIAGSALVGGGIYLYSVYGQSY